MIEDVNKSTNAYVMKNDKKYIMLCLVIVVVCFFAIVYLGLDVRLLIIPIALILIGYAHVKSKIKREFTKQFGASIGFTYSPVASTDGVKGRLFSVGHSQFIYDVLSGDHNGRDSRFFSYRFVVGSGRSSHTYNFTVFETAFTNNMPDITLMGKNGLFSSLDLPSGLSLSSGSESVELEGDFNKYFKLKVPKGYEQEAYQILTPNVMVALIDKAKGLDFEFNGNKLYIYATELVLVREKLQAMFDLAQYLGDLFSRSSRSVDITSLAQASNAGMADHTNEQTS